MSQKIRPLSDLFYRFKTKDKLDWQDIAIWLTRQGLIDLLANRDGSGQFSHYQDSDQFAALLKANDYDLGKIYQLRELSQSEME